MSVINAIDRPATQSTFFQKITQNPLDKEGISRFLNEMKAYFRVAYMEPRGLTAEVFRDFVPQESRADLEAGGASPFSFSMSAFKWVEIAYPPQEDKHDPNGRKNSQVVINAVVCYVEWLEHQGLMQLVRRHNVPLESEARAYYNANAYVEDYSKREKVESFEAFKAAIKQSMGASFEGALWKQYSATQQAISNAVDIVNIAAALPNSIANLTKELRLDKKTLRKVLKQAQKGGDEAVDKEAATTISELLEVCSDHINHLYKALNRVDEGLINYGDRHFKGYGFGYLANQVLYLYHYLSNTYAQWKKERAAGGAQAQDPAPPVNRASQSP